ncbi:hypothetical protein P154DRAFT_304613 [Amniculicola lignicola CBS 123094]|uniref:Uncharacterized protein n=1 Tax=Amniculicola lignicola CBS 123094 TaxID=1392246 RepID=A0A6A5W4Q2_9PLEO|nr:hypothetical protein P154DRAFT_304613 [Amniculicola lignicola CBS 123094]
MRWREAWAGTSRGYERGETGRASSLTPAPPTTALQWAEVAAWTRDRWGRPPASHSVASTRVTTAATTRHFSQPSDHILPARFRASRRPPRALDIGLSLSPLSASIAPLCSHTELPTCGGAGPVRLLAPCSMGASTAGNALTVRPLLEWPRPDDASWTRPSDLGPGLQKRRKQSLSLYSALQQMPRHSRARQHMAL